MRAPLLFAAALTLVACAGRPPPEAPTQGALDRETAPAAAEETVGRPATAEAPAAASNDRAGDLVCRASNSDGSETELYLKWDGNEAEGVLRETAPSGMVHQKNVRAERHKNLVVADDVYEKDVTTHAAVLAERAGKKVIKVQDAWSNCQ
jgi:hypothetical protein